MFDLSIYSIALLAHVVAATALVGSSLFAPLVHRSILTAESLGTLRLSLDLGRRAGSANPVLALVLLATGIYLGSAGWWTQAWFFVAVAAWLANSMLAVLVVKPAAVALGAAVGPREGAIDAKVDALRRSRGWAIAYHVMQGNDLAMLYVMFVKPELAEACLVIAGAIALVVVAWRRNARVLGARHAETAQLGPA